MNMSSKRHSPLKIQLVNDFKFPKRSGVIFSFAFLFISILLFQRCIEGVNGQFGVGKDNGMALVMMLN